MTVSSKMRSEKGMRSRVFRPNSAAAPATVGGKLAVIGHWGEPWEGGGKRRIREPGDLPSLA